MPSSKFQRWLDLIAFLVSRRYPVPVDDIMENVPAYAAKWVDGDARARDSVRRTFERDKDELRRLGIPIRTEQYWMNYGLDQIEGYRLGRRDFYLPYLRLITAGELEASSRGEPKVELEAADAAVALEALRRAAELPSFPLAAEARSAFRKLAFDLDPDAFGEAPVLFVDRPGADELAARVRVLSEALLARKRVRFRYHGIYRGTATDRDVAPYGLLFQRGHWYLIGHDATREDVRVFRVGRMEDVVANTKKPNTRDYEIPEDFRLDDYARREAWELGDETEAIRAEVLFHFPASLIAERNGYGELVEEREDGSAVRAFEVVQVDPFVRWILGQEGEAEVLAPNELAEQVRGTASTIAAVYQGGDDA